jgi:hypothetical protein
VKPEPGSRAEKLLVAATVLVPLLFGSLPAGRWLLPLVAPLTIYAGFAARVRSKTYYSAWKLGLLWAFLLAAGMVLWVYVAPESASRGTLQGEEYRQEMFAWISTGEARENDWRQFVPQHLLHLSVFAAASWLTAGYLGLAMGAALMNYMAYFVATYARASGHPFAGLFAAWVPWSVVRIMAFVLLGVLLARPVLMRRPWPFDAVERRLVLLALSGIAVDLLMKTLLAPSYGLFLRQLVRGALAP